MSETGKTKNVKRLLKGTVISTTMDKSVVVDVQSKKRHPKYEKIIKRNKKYLVHDEKSELREGDIVMIREVRPLSKRKRFTLAEVLVRAK